jgi:CRISPR/Cas system-associated protein endoribonuclease Cas2
MEAIKIVKKIDSKDLHIEELEKFIGEESEIIILPMTEKKSGSIKGILNLAGSIKMKQDPLQFQRKLREEWGDRI